MDELLMDSIIENHKMKVHTTDGTKQPDILMMSIKDFKKYIQLSESKRE